MNPRVKQVKPLSDYQLQLLFTNGERRVFDAKPYLNKGIFKELKDIAAFNAVRVDLGSVAWKNGQDLCPDTLYMDSIPVNQKKARAVRRHRKQSVRMRS